MRYNKYINNINLLPLENKISKKEKTNMFADFYCRRKVSFEELKEVMTLMENQETTDRYVDTTIHINGNDAEIDVKIDADGNVTLI